MQKQRHIALIDW